MLSEITDKLRPMVTFAFDDGFISDYEKAFPYLKEKGMRGTYFVITGTLGSDKTYKLSPEHLLEMSKAGHEIGSHTKDHVRLTEQGDVNLVDQLLDSKETIQEITNTPCISMSIPFGDVNERVEKMLGGFYENARSSKRGNNFYGHSPSHIYKSHFLDNKGLNDVDTIKQYIDTAYDKKQWIVISMHEIISDDLYDENDDWKTKESDFKEVVDYVDTLRPEIEVVTFSEGSQRIKGQFSVDYFNG